MHPLTLLTGLVSLFTTAATLSSPVVVPELSLGSGAAQLRALQTFESLRTIPKGWTKTGRPNPSSLLRLRIALHQPNHRLFEETLFAVSTPGHKSYGQHLKQKEVKALIKPKDESTQAVLSWLQQSGVSSSYIENNGEWINFYVSVTKAEAMMDTTFYYFTHDGDESGGKKVRTQAYSVPRSLSPHIAMIQPTTRFGQIRPQRSAPFKVAPIIATDYTSEDPPGPTTQFNISACSSDITPACLRGLYDMGDYQASPNFGSKLGVCGYLKEYAKYDALELFLHRFAPYGISQNFSYTLINGGLALQNDYIDDDVEANLDMQYAASLGFNTNITYYSTGGLGFLVPDLDQPDPSNNQNEPYLDFLTYMQNLPDHELPQTITTSYGEDEQSVPDTYSRVVCNMFGQLGMRGVSVVFASGDTGVGSACQTNDGNQTTRFLPVFPASCPYVTSVGATYSVAPERAIFFSSGGFSDRFPRPSYQNSSVQAYFNILGDQWEGLYNPNGRGFPDVAAQGWNFHVISKDPSSLQLSEILVGGTSAASPTFASIISVLNNARLSVGQAPLGFLNPWLYSTGKSGLNDIVHGGSQGCTGTDVYSGLPAPYVPYASWNATVGWDPVTGLGTPNFQKLLALSTPNNRLGHINRCSAASC